MYMSEMKQLMENGLNTIGDAKLMVNVDGKDMELTGYFQITEISHPMVLNLTYNKERTIVSLQTK